MKKTIAWLSENGCKNCGKLCEDKKKLIIR